MYRIDYLGIGKIENGRCSEAEKKLNEIAASVDRIVSLSPYALIIPGQPMLSAQGQLVGSAPSIMNVLVVISEQLEA